MKFFAAMLIVGALLLPFLALSAHGDPVPVTARAAPVLQAGPWVNGPPTTAAQRGKVTVLLFWTRGCINCKHNLGYWNDWAREYQGTDVTVLSVHTPETPGERSVGGVRRFAQERGLRFPVLIDNASQTWDAFGIRSWPTEVLIDKAGRVRAQYEGELDWQGSGEYRTVHRQIEALRAEKAARL